MHIHDWAERLSREHPVILDLKSRLRAEGFAKGAVEFLGRHIYFAYPRTLWFEWDVEIGQDFAVEDMEQRHGLDSVKTGQFLSAWLAEKSSIKNIVFDFTNVTIFDAEAIRDIFAATTADRGGAKYYVCTGEMAEHLRRAAKVDPKFIYPSQKAMLAQLREAPPSQRCTVALPASVDLLSLDSALQEGAAEEQMKNCDVVAFDFKEVKSIDFEAHCMFSPIIHSLAHRYGILATVVNVSSRIATEFGRRGTLRPMRSYLVNVPQHWLRRDDPPELTGNPLALHTFTPDTAEFRELWMDRLLMMFRYYSLWFAAVERIEAKETERRLGSSLKALQTVLVELTTNVLNHAYGIGYMAYELDPEPEKGLKFYVGDTGFGLAKGIKRSYQIPKPNDAAAVSMALSLGSLLEQRRKLKGALGFGGRGLELVGLLMRRLKGTVTVRSGNAMAVFSPTKDRHEPRVWPNLSMVQGTHLFMHIPSGWTPLAASAKSEPHA